MYISSPCLVGRMMEYKNELANLRNCFVQEFCLVIAKFIVSECGDSLNYLTLFSMVPKHQVILLGFYHFS